MKILKYIGISVLIAGSLFAAAFFVKTNNKSAITFETEKMFKTSIEKKTVVTGKVIPEDEVEITPQIQGIIDGIYVEEGDQVNNGDLLAKIKVVPNEQNLNSAEGRLANSRIILKNAKIEYERNKSLFKNGIISKHAKEIQTRLGWTDGKEEFLKFIRSKRYELETGWYLLDRTVYPNFDSTKSSLQLDELADRVRDLLTMPMDPRQTCLVINRVLFHEFGFRGAGKNFENPDNSYLHIVLNKKHGLPITLSLIYILVARRVGFELEPIGLPGRFMVGCFYGDIPFYLDVWAGGKMIELEDMRDYLGISIEESSGSILLPVTVSEMLTRGCRNLAHHYSLKGREKEASMFSLFVSEFEKIRGLETNA